MTDTVMSFVAPLSVIDNWMKAATVISYVYFCSGIIKKEGLIIVTDKHNITLQSEQNP